MTRAVLAAILKLTITAMRHPLYPRSQNDVINRKFYYECAFFTTARPAIWPGFDAVARPRR